MAIRIIDTEPKKRTKKTAEPSPELMKALKTLLPKGLLEHASHEARGKSPGQAALEELREFDKAKAKFDRNAYQREYMRKRRAKAKAAR